MLRKKDTGEGIVIRSDYPCRGAVKGPEGETVYVKNVLPGQRIRYRVTKKRETHYEGMLLSVLEKAGNEMEIPSCPAFPRCGGCLYLTLPYAEQIALKEDQLLRLVRPVAEEAHYDGMLASPKPQGYRNKMEFSFGDEEMGGALRLGFHKRGSTYDILMADQCALIDPDMQKVVRTVYDYCAENALPQYQKTRNTGYLRHLLLRRAETDGSLLIVLVTTSEVAHDFTPLSEALLALPLTGRIAGIFHGINDLPADTVQFSMANQLFGVPYLTEEMLGLRFKISVFSFFQTNTGGAARLYEQVRAYLREYLSEEGERPVIYDLYSGTGTIGQIVSAEASHVYGIEIVPEAVEAARENALANGITNTDFLCGDVQEKLEEIPEAPDFIILDPPREGMKPKALRMIAEFPVPYMIYISCKATSFVRDMTYLAAAGWEAERFALADLFPATPHTELIVKLKRTGDNQKLNPDGSRMTGRNFEET